MTVLELAGVCRLFPGGRGLNGVDLSIPAGEIYGLLGPNGAGKTSLVRAVSGRLRLDRGSVSLLGRDPAADPDVRRQLGLVPQEIALYADLSITENLELLARLAGMSRVEARSAIGPMLARIELVDRAGSQVSALSGGQRRRVNLAAGAMHRPRLLILDEPTVGVDLPARERIHAMLRDLKRDGAAILLATHDFEQARELCDRIGILVNGRIVAEGPPAELIARHFPPGSHELSITLGSDPPARSGIATRRALRQGADPLHWHGRLDGGLDRLPALIADLEQSGLAIRDAAVHEPSLRGVFRAVAGAEVLE